ncbi:halocyanin domain-containing protein [Halorientalis marina]|uniref:halocyanin domain-containing protein n=1 Tax=Halorientalis marina TaxID=2931976 RepID=UPI001FF4D947|nr:halocyanin domain-containing protein [Halorientalis marina]
MSDRTTGVSRRGFLRTAAGGTAVAAASGTAAAQDGTTTGTPTGTASGETRPDFGGYLEDVSNFEGEVVDERGQDEITIEVGAQGNNGAFAFAPAAVHIDSGTTVVFEWTGEGGGHNVVNEGGAFDSGDPVASAGVNFEYTFEGDGVYNYFCTPHKALGMKGAIVVGDDYPTTTGPFPGVGGGGGTTTMGSGTESGGGGGGGGAAGQPDLGGYLDDVENYGGSVTSMRGQGEATVEVGVDNGGQPYGFGPAAVWVDTGTTVKWEWTGEGGGHNVIAEDETFDSGSAVASAGVNFEYTFEESGVYQYYCAPHKSLGMKGVIVVGDDVPTVAPAGGGGGGGGSVFPNSAKTIGVATSFVMAATLGLAYFFMRYGGDYDTPE